MGRLAVVAIGGNSLIKSADRQSIADQWEAMAETATHIAAMIDQGWDVVVTHGNGPQVGFILLRSELASHVLHTVPLDVCGADTQGASGIWRRSPWMRRWPGGPRGRRPRRW